MGVLILERNEPGPLGRRAMKRVTCGSGGRALISVPLGPLLSSLTAPPLSPLSSWPMLFPWAGKETWEEAG